MEEVDRTVHHMQDEAANFPDPADRATQEEEFSLELRTRDRERKLIKKINQSLDEIDNEEYGFCHTCGVEIGIRRLEARPTATLCIECKTLEEIRKISAPDVANYAKFMRHTDKVWQVIDEVVFDRLFLSWRDFFKPDMLSTR